MNDLVPERASAVADQFREAGFSRSPFLLTSPAGRMSSWLYMPAEVVAGTVEYWSNNVGVPLIGHRNVC